VALTYHDYDGVLGPLRAVFTPWILALSAGVWIAALRSTFPLTWAARLLILVGTFLLVAVPAVVPGKRFARVSLAVAAGGMFLWLTTSWWGYTGLLSLLLTAAGWGLLLTAPTLAERKRRTRADGLKADMTRTTTYSGLHPHVIAHSLGTFLTGAILSKFHNSVALDRIVLVGCVLPRGFEWQALLARRRDAFSEVRNETGAKDWVVFLAWLAGGRFGLGRAGLLGFKEPKTLAHVVSDARSACSMCTPTDRHTVHNVPLGDFLHSDYFLGPDHAHVLWLPFLWGFVPAEFEHFVTVCCAHVHYRERGSPEQIADFDLELRTNNWSWYAGTLEQCISSYLEKRVSAAPTETIDQALVIDRAISHLALTVHDALHEKMKPEGRDEDVIVALHPWIGLRRAIEAARRPRTGDAP
jgi:hypothetical protein